ncbi:ABC transporter substrate-binding protein [Micromonospora sp. WMMD1128]|uniref:ABC transporter substrate-binding protein n=1 Tax=Micromonospora sp. WMMD1128 TaxID=3015150 RepID=UPI00248BD0AA|nr:ABC transporter substrate-binding protein [Micromonospora sp. WMMD1128]WBB71360.1 ABC transporter substrate-binding protein [Micromonospora sp. WMMD1128]
MRVQAAAAALLMTVAVSACSENQSAGESGGGDSGAPAAAVNFGVGVDPAYSPIYLADQEKLFEEAGLDVTVTQYQEGTGGLDAILAKQGQVTASTESSLLNRSARGDIKGLAVFSQSPDFIKLVARSGITDVAGIKKYGVVPGTVNEYATNKVLDNKGISRDAVEFVKASPAEMPALLQRGDIDGYIMWEPWPSRGVANGGKVLLTSGDIGYVYNLVIGVDGAWYEANKETAKKVVDTVGKACEQLTADPAKAGTVTEKAIKVPAAEAQNLLKGVQCQVRDFTDEDIKRYNEIAQFQLDNKIVNEKVEAGNVMVRGVA